MIRSDGPRESLVTALAVHAEGGHCYGDRYGQAEAVVRALDAYLDSFGLLTRPPGKAEVDPPAGNAHKRLF